MPQVADAPVEVHWFDLRDPTLLSPDELSPDEHRRTARLQTDILRRRYTASHVALRRLLSSRLGVAEPGCLALSMHRGVKPRLCSPPSSLTFSLSRTGDMAAVALGDGVEVGIDVEADHPAFESQGLHEAILTPFERAAVADLGAWERGSAAQRFWVRKEAIVKALGTGFNGSPSSIAAGHPLHASGLQTCGTRNVRWMDVAVPHERFAAAVAWCAPTPPRTR